jgi:hypothetical protein
MAGAFYDEPHHTRVGGNVQAKMCGRAGAGGQECATSSGRAGAGGQECATASVVSVAGWPSAGLSYRQSGGSGSGCRCWGRARGVSQAKRLTVGDAQQAADGRAGRAARARLPSSNGSQGRAHEGHQRDGGAHGCGVGVKPAGQVGRGEVSSPRRERHPGVTITPPRGDGPADQTAGASPVDKGCIGLVASSRLRRQAVC